MNNHPSKINSSHVSVTHLSKDGHSDFLSDPNSALSQESEASPFRLFREKIENENIHFEWPTDVSSSQQLKLERDMRYIEKVEEIQTERIDHSSRSSHVGIRFFVEK